MSGGAVKVQHIRSDQRYRARHGWLDTRHHFSFAEYYDPANMAFGALRVFNDDRVAAASGFGTHGHREMEIVTLMVEGSLEHRDSTGNRITLRAGDVQRMTAGTGIAHSEVNPDPQAPCRLLQVWVLPALAGLEPGYEQRNFDPAGRVGRLERVVSGSPSAGELLIHQDADFHLGSLPAGAPWSHASRPGRRQYLFVVRGSVDVEDLAPGDGGAVRLEDGDQARVVGATGLRLTGADEAGSDLVLIDLA